MAYGFTLTAAGRNLLMRLQAGETMNISRITVGSGILDENTDPAYLTDLINPVAQATSTVPTVEDNVLSMTVEYRNDMNGGLQGNFWLSEYGIFARDTSNPDNEVLLYYADLSAYPEPVIAWNDGKTPVMKRYPVQILIVADDISVSLDFSADAFVIHEDLIPLIDDIDGLKTEAAKIDGKEDKSDKGVAGGYASLDENAKVPLGQIPDAIVNGLVHAGEVDASTGIATLTDDGKTILGTTAATITLTDDTAAVTGYTANQGNFYLVETAGTFAGLTLNVGDRLVANATGWDMMDFTDSVTGVKGNKETVCRTGLINLTPANVGAEPALPAGTAAQYLNGARQFVDLPIVLSNY